MLSCIYNTLSPTIPSFTPSFSFSIGLPASKGGFLSLVMETGPDTAASLKEMARVAWEAKQKKDQEQGLRN